MKTRRFLLRAGALAVAAPAMLRAGALAQSGQADSGRVKLTVGYQDHTFPQLVAASGILKDRPYDVEWAVIAGPAAQLAALYSRAIDIGHMGDTSLIIEQARAAEPWTPSTAPLQIIAGWRNFEPGFTPIVTAVHADSAIRTLSDLRGKRWAYNFGGLNHLQYILSLKRAGLKYADIQPVQLGDGNAAAAAFNSRQVDAYSGGTERVQEGIEAGKVRVVLTNDDLGIAGLGTFTARRDVIDDPAKRAAVEDVLTRFRSHWDWIAENGPAVERILVERLKYTPLRAKLAARQGRARFGRFDEAFLRGQQVIADTLLEAGFIPKAVDIRPEFATQFNAVTVPA